MFRTSLKRIAYAGVIILWIVTTSVLVSRHYRPAHDERLKPFPVTPPAEFFGERWMGVYFRGAKIGYSRRVFDRMQNGYRLSERLMLHFILMGTEKQLESDTEAILASDLALREFHAVLKADADIDIRGKAQDGELAVTMTTAGGSTSRVIPFAEGTSLGLSMLPALLVEEINKGRRVEVTILDPTTFSLQLTPIEVVGREKAEAAGLRADAYKLKGSIKGTDFFVWITDKGEVLREESPAGFTLVSESRAEAMRNIGASTDVAAQASFPFNLSLPSETEFLKVRISGLDPRKFELDGGRQRYRNGILYITREDLRSRVADRPLSEGEKAEVDRSLQEGALVQSKDQRIISLSADIVRGERDAVKAAQLICDWVFTNIEKTPSVTFPSAVDILLSRKGDCNEHTTLYAALARAAGIPTRMVAGFVYQNGRLYYHAWPEIFAGRWIAVDPTFGQFPADAAHIRLVTGEIDRQLNLISVMDEIKIEGLEYR